MPLSETKLSEEQKADAINRYELGETYTELAKEFGVAVTTVRKYIRKGGGKKPVKPKITPATSMVSFTKRAKSILWRQDSGSNVDRKSYNKWMQQVEDFINGGMNKQQAVVQASKDFPCLERLFREYDTSDNDPHPDSHPTIQQYGQQELAEQIEVENKEQSHRENLVWAIDAAGKFLRTGEAPVVAPNDAAYFLFRQARDDPKDFLGRFTQADARADSNSEEQRLAKRSGKKSITEIEEMLETLTEGKGVDE